MFIAGNWKMNTDRFSAIALARRLAETIDDPGEAVKVAVCVPFPLIDSVTNSLKTCCVAVGAQNVHEQEKGAYTGEVSATMLTSVGCTYVIVGHSERRQYFGETDTVINQKVQRALAHKLTPILCIGETLAEREAGEAQAVVQRQLQGALTEVEVASPEALVVAYEPVWAIGTGKTATPDQAQEMHAFIRQWLTGRYGPELAGGIDVLYGGSMKPGNASDLLEQPDVNGGLIGGASLHPDDFLAIVETARVSMAGA
ncbi:MAG: triose-phosphate isomerase [Bacteroidota bacterium]